MILSLRKIGGSDIDNLTAQQSDVLSGKKFVGQGSEDVKEGSMPERGSPTYTLSANGELTLPSGHYSGGKVTQNIATMGAQIIDPGANQIVVQTAGKYMTDDVIVNPVANLTPDVIKLGEYVGGVGPGTWNGYVIDDPDILIYRGSMQEGQRYNKLKYFNNEYVNDLGTARIVSGTLRLEIDKKESLVLSFTKPINLDTKTKLIIQIESEYGSVEWENLSAKILFAQNLISGPMVDMGYNPELGNYHELGRMERNYGEFDVSGINGWWYVYFCYFHTYGGIGTIERTIDLDYIKIS